MRTETKVIQVANSPSEINAVNASQALWGWSVLSVQITDRKTVYDGDTTGYVNELGLHATTQRITETANYATITYSRDLDAPNVEELRRLEREYENQTALAAMYLCERKDEEWLEDWPEELAWYQDYQSKQAEKAKALIPTIIVACLPFSILSPMLSAVASKSFSLLDVLLIVCVPALWLIFCLKYVKRFLELRKHLNDPQTQARLAQIRQHIDEAKAQYRAQYSDAMALRASLVKQAQALTGA